MPGFNVYEIFILIVLALVLLGPERLPQYAQSLARWVKKARHWADDAKVRFKEETGADFDDVDWQKYDPRQYDPRRIIRDALADELDDVSPTGTARPAPGAARVAGGSSSKPIDPLELFGGGSGSRGALAAGVAGAAAAGAASTDATDPGVPEPAPYDADAT
ncbi:Sec-independent protein translocase TatB [Nesterenkonia sphaerica]|uniref:Sec-independent protein translocase TatB n=1 Tax=Nesterenkonia sphaerica TaxID=1804988 RepID=A0A5R9AM23_9MICC|nr:Sec-independent protein translocase TatB [Nesterenkonia sphaerica]TLP78867.1 Sec-independent protein translocase TatB [Nesterenkonia sphaerica]